MELKGHNIEEKEIEVIARIFKSNPYDGIHEAEKMLVGFQKSAIMSDFSAVGGKVLRIELLQMGSVSIILNYSDGIPGEVVKTTSRDIFWKYINCAERQAKEPIFR